MGSVTVTLRQGLEESNLLLEEGATVASVLKVLEKPNAAVDVNGRPAGPDLVLSGGDILRVSPEKDDGMAD